MLVCPQCGRSAEVAPGEHPFCRQCDYPLFWVAPRARAVQPAPATDRAPLGPICVVCRTANQPERSLCARCGQPLAPLMPRRRRTWEDAAPAERPVNRWRRVLLLAGAVLVGLVLLAALAVALWYFLWPRSEWQTVALDQGEASWDVSATLRRDIPVIAYVDAGDNTLRVVVCGNALCDASEAANSYTTVTVIGEGGEGYGTAVAIGIDGRPVIAFRDGIRRALMVAHCGDPSCSDPGAITISEVDPGDGSGLPGADVGANPSIAIGRDGLPIIAYHDAGRGALKIAHCEDGGCSEATIAILDRPAGAASAGVGLDTAIAIGPDGLPVVAFRDATESALKLARCSDERCTQAVIATVVAEPGLDPGHDTSMALAPDGSPILAYADWSDDGVYVAKCSDAACSSATARRVDRAEDGASGDPALGLDRDGHPVVAFRQRAPGDERASRVLRIVRCRDLACLAAGTPETVDDRGRTGYTPSVLQHSDGTLALVYGDATEGALEYAVYLRRAVLR